MRVVYFTDTPEIGGAELARQLGALRGAFAVLEPDVVHVNNGGFPGSDLCRIAPLAARLARAGSRVMSVHTVPWNRAFRSRPEVQALADRLVWANLDAVVCPARAVMDGLLADRGMPARLGRLLHYGVAEPSWDDGEAAALRARLAPAGELLVGMVSNRPVTEKGYDVLLGALAGTPEVRGVIVGPVPEGLSPRAEELGIAGRLALEGPQRSVGSYYRAVDVLAVPSTAYEAMPLVILEAMAAHRPAIGSRLSGIPEAIVDGETGMTFPPGDAGALRTIIAEAASTREQWSAMGDAARRRWELMFTRPTMAEGLLALYRGLVGAPGATRGAGTSPADTSLPTDAERARRASSA
jgi:glycosyltransferase involved in cell wall biosynthesis